ncbi:MAG: oxidoreductase [Candidatus Scalindua rubra]|uniref:Oxidoreductase n=1 Tax=Candidatus Scalindua rubra TaxID=1872076 RepID=A0A1E3XB02_9BACT|nr:MAG: oxidoreductase [Candidatus Scalindua rubra]
MDDRLQIPAAQIGCGYWGPNLLRNLIANKECSIKTVVDIIQKRREFVKEHYPYIEVAGDVKNVFNDELIDAVVIATPAETHYGLAIAALEAGKHILVEKPMAMTVEEVDDIRNVSEKNGLVAMVGHTFIYNTAVRYLKKVINSGELGDIRYIYSQRLNLGRIRSDVNALWNLAPHDISIIQFLLDDPEPVFVTKHGMDYVQTEIDDVVFMNIFYPNKVIAHIHVSWLDPHKIRRMTVVGSQKMVVYDDISDNKIAIYDKGIDRMAVLGEHMDFDNPTAFSFNHRSGDVLLPKIAWQEPLKVEIEHFVDCIQNGTKCLSGLEHAKKVVGILSTASKHDI